MDKLITNNPMAAERFAKLYDIQYNCLYADEILKIIRNYVHLGHKLLTHPLASSIPSGHTPYKTVLISGGPLVSSVDYESLKLIEAAIAAYAKEGGVLPLPDKINEVYSSYMLVDCEMLAKGIS